MLFVSASAQRRGSCRHTPTYRAGTSCSHPRSSLTPASATSSTILGQSPGSGMPDCRYGADCLMTARRKLPRRWSAAVGRSSHPCSLRWSRGSPTHCSRGGRSVARGNQHGDQIVPIEFTTSGSRSGEPKGWWVSNSRRTTSGDAGVAGPTAVARSKLTTACRPMLNSANAVVHPQPYKSVLDLTPVHLQLTQPYAE